MARPWTRSLVRRAGLLTASLTVSAGALVGVPGAAEAKPPTPGLVKASREVAKGVVAAIDARDTSRSDPPTWCFDVWVARSDGNWATWTWSPKAAEGGNLSVCQPTDGFREFLTRKGGSKWVYAGRFTGRGDECLWEKKAPASVRRDMGCGR